MITWLIDLAFYANNLQIMAGIPKARVETISRHLTGDNANFLADSRPRLILEDHPVDAVRSLKVPPNLNALVGLKLRFVYR